MFAASELALKAISSVSGKDENGIGDKYWALATLIPAGSSS